MWHDGWTHDEMMGWTDGGWHWLFGFHGILSLLFLVVIVFALVALIRDRRRDQAGNWPPSVDRPHAGRDEHERYG